MSHPELSILIPAAGGSVRLGRAKQLVEYNGKPLILNAVTIASSVGPGEILVVKGANAERVEKAVSHPAVRWVHNPEWSEGMGGSIAKGVTEVNPKSTGLMILLCDQWSLVEQDLQSLVKIWLANPDRVVCARVNDINMPPVIFPSRCFAQLRDLNGKQGARKLLKTYADILTPVTLPNAAFDLDTPAQLKRWGQSQVPE